MMHPKYRNKLLIGFYLPNGQFVPTAAEKKKHWDKIHNQMKDWEGKQ